MTITSIKGAFNGIINGRNSCRSLVKSIRDGTILKIPKIAVVGMDLGYYTADTSLFQTQNYYCLLEEGIDEQDLHEYFPEFIYPDILPELILKRKCRIRR